MGRLDTLLLTLALFVYGLVQRLRLGRWPAHDA